MKKSDGPANGWTKQRAMLGEGGTVNEKMSSKWYIPNPESKCETRTKKKTFEGLTKAGKERTQTTTIPNYHPV
jgi:hypothetical protein